MWLCMRKRASSIPLAVWLIGAFLAGCATPAERELNMAQTAPKTTRLSDEGCYAACSYETVGGHLGPWIGPLRSDKADALRDALGHDRAYPGHHAVVVRY